MTAKMVREWKAGYEEVNRVVLEEKRQTSPEKRLRDAERLLDQLRAWNRLPKREDNLEYHLKWQRLREKWSERHGNPS